MSEEAAVHDETGALESPGPEKTEDTEQMTS
jgi:hypothetical protein